jgi:hypothetical protein
MSRLGPGCVIGVDFDNTIACYDRALRSIAVSRGWVAPDGPGDKREIREAIRRLAGGEIVWQQVQAEIYGRRIHEAELMPGARSFFTRCRSAGVEVHIVSHKTEFAAFDDTRTNLRQAAREWLRRQRAFDPDGLGLDSARVWFTANRAEKIARIVQLKCAYFVDDLIEVFTEPEFPCQVGKLLLAVGGEVPTNGISAFRTWSDIERHLFAE